MSKFWMALLILISTTKAFAQLPTAQWAKAFVPDNNPNNRDEYSNGRSIAVDKQGNVYSVGLFQYIIDFDPGPAKYDLSSGANGYSAIYLSKLSPTGNFLWAIPIPALVEFGEISLTLDKEGNPYVAATFTAPGDFDPGPGVLTLTPIGAHDAFVTKYDPNGNLVWAKQFGGPGLTVPACDKLTVDNNDDVVIGGHFNETVDFDPGPGTYNLSSPGTNQSFLVKLTNAGNFIWAKQFPNGKDVSQHANIADLKCDGQNNIYLTGNFSGSCNFDPGVSDYTLKGPDQGDEYIAKLNSVGQFVWAKAICNGNNTYYNYIQPYGLTIDAENNVYATGFFDGQFDFDPGNNIYNITANSQDWFVLKLNKQGDFMWADAFASDNNEQDIGSDVAVDNAGNVWVTGVVGKAIDLDPGPGVYKVTSTNVYGAAALVKLSSNGSFISGGLFDGYGGGGNATPRRMTLDDVNNIYITGSMYGTVDFDPGTGILPLTADYGESPFVVKLAKCTNPTTATLNITACSSYTLNKEIFDSTGTYIRTIPNSYNCDSIITLNLTINKKFAEQSIDICDGEFFFAGGKNQTTAGTYKDTLVSSLNCDSIVTTHLTIRAKPSPNLGADQDLCAGSTLTITPGTFSKYEWQDKSTSDKFKITGAGLYWVTVTNNANCSATDSFKVANMLPLPTDFLQQSDSVCEYEKLTLTPSRLYNKYLWSTGSNDSKVMINAPGQYWLEVTDANGCVGKQNITVYKKDCMNGVYIPNAFTPNNDGKNDVFRALVFGNVLSFKLQVFDRAGQLIFETNNPNQGWDGTNKGVIYPGSVLVWQCFYQLDQQKPGYQKGTVTLVR
jgi:gliding motility-associated-like protein